MKKIIIILFSLILLVLIYIILNHYFFPAKIDERKISVISDVMIDTWDIWLMNEDYPMTWNIYIIQQWTQLGWIWSKIIWKHTWTIDVKKWYLILENNKIIWWEFIINMDTIVCTDTPSLVWHLKSADFFDVQTYPESKITIKEVLEKADSYEVIWDLTIKDVTKQITFPASISIDNDKIQAKAEFFIDRTEFDITYWSKKFFGSLWDAAIDDLFQINFDIILDRK